MERAHYIVLLVLLLIHSRGKSVCQTTEETEPTDYTDITEDYATGTEDYATGTDYTFETGDTTETQETTNWFTTTFEPGQ